jgi:hypothetical protein
MKKLLLSSCTYLLSCSRHKNHKKTADQKKTSVLSRPKNLSDTALLELVQKQTFRYFWDFAHPVSGLARERSNVAFDYGGEVVTTGGSGFGIMGHYCCRRKEVDFEGFGVGEDVENCKFSVEGGRISWRLPALAQWGDRQGDQVWEER